MSNQQQPNTVSGLTTAIKLVATNSPPVNNIIVKTVTSNPPANPSLPGTSKTGGSVIVPTVILPDGKLAQFIPRADGKPVPLFITPPGPQTSGCPPLLSFIKPILNPTSTVISPIVGGGPNIQKAQKHHVINVNKLKQTGVGQQFQRITFDNIKDNDNDNEEEDDDEDDDEDEDKDSSKDDESNDDNDTDDEIQEIENKNNDENIDDKSFVNEFPQLITIHGLTTERNNSTEDKVINLETDETLDDSGDDNNVTTTTTNEIKPDNEKSGEDNKDEDKKQENEQSTEKQEEKATTENKPGNDNNAYKAAIEEYIKKQRGFKRPSILGPRKKSSPTVTFNTTTKSKKHDINVKPAIENKKQEVNEKPAIDLSSFKPVSKDFDPVKALEWQDNGVGILPGSTLKFKVNEFGIMEFIEDEQKVVLKEKSNKNELKLSKQSIKSGPAAEVKKRSRKDKLNPDDILCCDNCGCYGIASEFKSKRYCSAACDEVASRRRGYRRNKRPKIQEVVEPEPIVETPSNPPSEVNTPDISPATSEIGDDVAPIPPVNEAIDLSAEVNLLPWEIYTSDKKVQFSWQKYLDHMKAKAAPMKLFAENGFPYQRNSFKVGMRLEGIDPRNPSQFCALSVVSVKGYRIKLRFEGWPDSHDFWVNADSKDIFVVGFCEKTGRTLVPPRNYNKSNFNWTSYLKSVHANAAPRQLFVHRMTSKNAVAPSGFRIGMKLEAVDKQNLDLICVATINDILDGRLLIHFDSWDSCYDYWAEPNSPYIHPVGWCQENGRKLTPPNGYTTFNWDNYLKETKSCGAPSRSFKTKSLIAFKKGMKLECVDPRYSEFVRVATVYEVKDHRLKIIFDGWPEEVAIWVENDSPDIHPMGWCAKTGYVLTSPPTPNEEHRCITPGCRALLKNSQFILPHSSGFCPLSSNNITKVKKGLREDAPVKKSKNDTENTTKHTKVKNDEIVTRKRKMNSVAVTEPSTSTSVTNSNTTTASSTPTISPSSSVNKIARKEIHESIFSPDYTPKPVTYEGNWRKHAILLQLDPEQIRKQSSVLTWTPKQVDKFINQLDGCGQKNKIFQQEKIDGEALLLLTQSDLTEMLGFKTGQAIKIINSINILKKAQEIEI